jgi:hypothetical protein
MHRPRRVLAGAAAEDQGVEQAVRAERFPPCT